MKTQSKKKTAQFKKNPLQQVKDLFGSKDKLVEELVAMIKKPSQGTKEEFKQKLGAQSNKKLLTLHQREKALTDRFGSREKLIDAILKARMGKKNLEDKDYRKRLDRLSTGQLLNIVGRAKSTKQK
jgi:hypothetical protein